MFLKEFYTRYELVWRLNKSHSLLSFLYSPCFQNSVYYTSLDQKVFQISKNFEKKLVYTLLWTKKFLRISWNFEFFHFWSTILVWTNFFFKISLKLKYGVLTIHTSLDQRTFGNLRVFKNNLHILTTIQVWTKKMVKISLIFEIYDFLIYYTSLDH